MEDSSGKLEIAPELCGIDKISVMNKSKITLDMADNKRLDITVGFSSRSRIANVTDRYIAFSEAVEFRSGENLGNETVVSLMTKNSVIADSDTAAFLTSVLKCIKSEVNRGCNIGIIFFKNSENAAFFVDGIKHKYPPN